MDVEAARMAPPKLGVVSNLSEARQQHAAARTRETLAEAVARAHFGAADGTTGAFVPMPQEAMSVADERVEAAEPMAATGTDGATAAFENVFIPPAPVSKGDLDPAKTAETAAGVATGAGEGEGEAARPRNRMSSLFARMTGTSRPKPARSEGEAEAHEDPTRKAPRIGAMNAEERLPSSKHDEDLLDIPAFLRRQAN
jgi:cell division protein FtsZ